MQGFKWSIQNLQCSTFLSWGSICFQLLAFNWWSSSNFILIFSMDNCSISQNPAKSWEVGRGCALGFCTREERKKNNSLALVSLNVKHLCKWLQILLAKQFQQIQTIRETQTTEISCQSQRAAPRHCAPMGPRHHQWVQRWQPEHTEFDCQPPLHFNEVGFPAIFMLVGWLIPVQAYSCCVCR